MRTVPSHSRGRRVLPDSLCKVLLARTSVSGDRARTAHEIVAIEFSDLLANLALAPSSSRNWAAAVYIRMDARKDKF